MPDPSPENPAEAKPAEATDVKPAAESSPAEKSEKSDKGEKGDMLSAVKAALKPKEESPSSDKADPKSEPETPEAPKEGEDEDDGEDFTEEEKSQLKAKTRRRFDQLTQNNAEMKATLEAIQPKAEQFEKIVTFVDEAGLAPGEVNSLLDVGANLKRNPRKAYEQLKPVFETLQKMFGDVLPDDLQAEVNQGRLTPDHAKTVAASRSEAAIAAQNETRLREQQARQQAAQATEAQVNTVKSKVTEWETSKSKTDPDWSLKQPDVMQAIKIALYERGQGGKPLPSAAEAVEIADKALADVNAKFARLAPRRKEVKPITDAASTPSTAKPATALEAARAGLAKAAAG